MPDNESNSTSTTQTSTTTETKNVNATDFNGSAIVAEGDVTLTNAKAFELAAGVTTAAIQAVSNANTQALQGAKEFSEKQQKETLDFASGVVATATPIQNAIKYGALIYVATKAIKIIGPKI